GVERILLVRLVGRRDVPERHSAKVARLKRSASCRFPTRPFVVMLNPTEGGVMQYMLLIYDDEQTWANLSEAERGQIFQAYGAYTEDMRQKGAFVAGDALQPTSTATTVRERNGDRLVTDGPFAETKEQLGGYYAIEVDSLDDALDWAPRISSAKLVPT